MTISAQIREDSVRLELLFSYNKKCFPLKNCKRQITISYMWLSDIKQIVQKFQIFKANRQIRLLIG